MPYNAKRLDIKVLSRGHDLLFKVVKISLGLLIHSRKMHALFRENRHLGLSTSTTVNSRLESLLPSPKFEANLIA